MLLVSIHGSFANRVSCAWEVFVVTAVVHKESESEIRSYKVTAFEVHTPSAGFIGKVILQWCVELPVHVSVSII